jgi:glycine amidinotransferase
MNVNSFDEWSPLREVIVGSPINYNLQDLEISFKLFFHDNAFLSFYYPAYEQTGSADAGAAPSVTSPAGRPTTHVFKKQYLEELAEDVDGFVTTLTRLGVKVHRPLPLDRVIRVKTPYWETTCVPALNVRDQAIILGDEILETAPQIRARYFENDLLKPVFHSYFKTGSRWTSMPKPMMTDRSFDLSYVKETGRDMVATEAVYAQEPSPFDCGHEIMIDAAQCVRFGKDILVNVATANHEAGYQWLARHCGDRFRLHRVYRMTDNHIDSIILPLRPGKLLLREPKYLDMLPAPLKKWDIIYPPEPMDRMFPAYTDDELLLTSKYIDLNVLSIDPERVIVNSQFPELMNTLEKHGFTPIPVQHRHRRLFGGGFHCFTLDTVRAGKQEDYFS